MTARRVAMGLEADGSIRWRLHLRRAPEVVFAFLATDAGRVKFWARSSRESQGRLRLEFGNGQVVESEIVARQAPRHFALTYFGGSRVTFELADDGAGGTDLELRERGVPAAELADNLPGWISVLLALKAAADFGIDLRNHDPGKRWEDGYVDV